MPHVGKPVSRPLHKDKFTSKLHKRTLPSLTSSNKKHSAPLGSQSDTKAQLRHGRVPCAASLFLADNPCACITQPHTNSCTSVTSMSPDHTVRHACGNTTQGIRLYATSRLRRIACLSLGTIFQQDLDMGQKKLEAHVSTNLNTPGTFSYQVLQAGDSPLSLPAQCFHQHPRAT